MKLVPRPVEQAARRLVRRALGSKFEVVFHERYTAALPGIPTDALRAEHILAFLAAEGLALRRSVIRPEPASLQALGRVHTEDYLDSVHDPRVMTSALGVEVAQTQVDRLIDEQRLQVGGTMAAVRRARGGRVAVNLGGGFHHAHADHGAGFCLFNDVAIAIAAERRRGFRGRILVVDLDVHDGDGTRDIFRDDPEVYTFSMHGRHWGETEAVASTAIELGSGCADVPYLETLNEHLPAVFASHRPRLVIYLAGTDPAHDDLLGDGALSAAGLLERDRLVAELAKRRGAGLAVLLSGGYGPNAWRYTARFLGELESGRLLEPPPTELMTLARYRHIARLFSSAELSGGGASGNLGITDADLMLPGWQGLRETRLLGFYTKHAVELVFERAGMFDRLRDLGYETPTLELLLDDPAGHAMRLYGDPDREALLVEIRVRRDRRTLPEFELLSLEWLLMQNPREDFSPSRPRMPGQEHPGLGMLGDAFALLILVCERLHMDGLVFTPSGFHIAAYGSSYVRFVDPEHQAHFEAMAKALAGVPLPGELVDRYYREQAPALRHWRLLAAVEQLQPPSLTWVSPVNPTPIAFF
ncbi:MAG: histone deacetylase, partial [Acidobacteriota bacterium]